MHALFERKLLGITVVWDAFAPTFRAKTTLEFVPGVVGFRGSTEACWDGTRQRRLLRSRAATLGSDRVGGDAAERSTDAEVGMPQGIGGECFPIFVQVPVGGITPCLITRKSRTPPQNDFTESRGRGGGEIDGRGGWDVAGHRRVLPFSRAGAYRWHSTASMTKIRTHTPLKNDFPRKKKKKKKVTKMVAS